MIPAKPRAQHDGSDGIQLLAWPKGMVGKMVPWLMGLAAFEFWYNLLWSLSVTSNLLYKNLLREKSMYLLKGNHKFRMIETFTIPQESLTPTLDSCYALDLLTASDSVNIFSGFVKTEVAREGFLLGIWWKMTWTHWKHGNHNRKNSIHTVW